ncbi:MAG: hypothetical protein GY948_12240 [Alphaproteobacteria bacterium]|nr:hypothetical protein [Alphaproteobacteria bacterium]
MSWYTKNQAVARSSTLGLLVLAGAVTVDFQDAPANIIRQQPETVQATKVSLVSLRASLQNPAEMLETGNVYFDLDAPVN